MPAALTVAAGAALSSPLAAQAAVTPSLKNLINSVIAGAHTRPFSLLLVPASFWYTLKSMHSIRAYYSVSWRQWRIQKLFQMT